jgi:hypothetical chaperone protein
MFVGIDFGTTNSAIAIAAANGDVRLVELPSTTGAQPYWRTVLYFEPNGELSAGAPAIARYLETEGEGRLVQSIKSHLASASFSTTTILGRRWSLEDIVAAYLRKLREATPIELGPRCVVGRPVHYWGAQTANDDARAVERMRSALANAGFEEVVFEYEPVGASARYAARLEHEQLIVVADFGGGTTDFSVIRVGPHEEGSVLATGGIGVSGDAFDARIIDAVIAPALGRGTRFRDELGAQAPVPAWLYGHLRRWHYLSFLKEESTLRLLQRVSRGAVEPTRVGRLVRVVHDDLGLLLHRAVEGAKVRLSRATSERICLDPIELEVAVTRSSLEDWIAEDLAAIEGVLDDVLTRAGVAAGAVDRVFATGGSSLVPLVQARLAARFGADRLEGGDELTSVAWGLAARAHQLWA